ncbi:hypothetical protein ACFFSH_36600 [Streptomyces filamentosus]|nr:hypothetical protein [Streptomyces filamentosus]
MTGPRHGTPFDSRRRHIQNVLIGVVSLVALLSGATLLIGVLPRAAADEHAFLSASPCHDDSMDDCLRTTWFSVDSVRVRHGKSSGGEVGLSGPESGSRTVKFSGVDEFLERTRPGDRVEGTLWRGSIVLLSDAEGGRRTDAHPAGSSLFAAGFGIVLVLAGGLGAFAAWWWIRHSDGSPVRQRLAPGIATGSVVAWGLYTFALTVVLYERDASLQRFFTLWAPAAAIGVTAVLWQPLRARRRAAARSLRHRSG